MRGLINLRDTSIMAESQSNATDSKQPVKAATQSADDSSPTPPNHIPIVPATTTAEALPGNDASALCQDTSPSAPLSSDANSNASSTQNLSVTPNGHTYDVLQNGHLSPSDDSGTSTMSDHGSQSSQSPNQCFSTTTNAQPAVPQGPTACPSLKPTTPHSDGGNISPIAPLPLHPMGGGHPYHHHPQHGGGHSSSSPGSYSPNSQRGGDSPSLAHDPTQQQQPGGSGLSPQGAGGGAPSQHIVLVHVNPGETFSVRVGDQIQHIQGMYVNNVLYNS